MACRSAVCAVIAIVAAARPLLHRSLYKLMTLLVRGKPAYLGHLALVQRVTSCPRSPFIFRIFSPWINDARRLGVCRAVLPKRCHDLVRVYVSREHHFDNEWIRQQLPQLSRRLPQR